MIVPLLLKLLIPTVVLSVPLPEFKKLLIVPVALFIKLLILPLFVSVLMSPLLLIAYCAPEKLERLFRVVMVPELTSPIPLGGAPETTTFPLFSIKPIVPLLLMPIPFVTLIVPLAVMLNVLKEHPLPID